MAQLDSIIHQPVRLEIMSSLVALGLDEQVDFACLRNLLKVTDGNLGAHLARLEEAGYIRIDKAFVDRKPRTFVSATDKGRDAFAGHVGALEAILRRPTDRAFLQAIYKRPPGF
jgi:DNA-binding MarR family transcriptional regulator